MLRTILSILDVLICMALSVCVLMQEGKQAGLGAISGSQNTYFKKGRTKEGKLFKTTVVLSIMFFALSIALAMHPFA